MYFYIGLFKDFCLKDVSNVWERGGMGILPSKEGLGKGVYTRFYLTTSKGAPPSKLLHFFTDKKI